MGFDADGRYDREGFRAIRLLNDIVEGGVVVVRLDVLVRIEIAQETEVGNIRRTVVSDVDGSGEEVGVACQRQGLDQRDAVAGIQRRGNEGRASCGMGFFAYS